MTAESTTIKNTTSNNKDACSGLSGVLSMRGKVAKVIGTAPLSPTHERKASSFRVKPNANAYSSTASGRARKNNTRLIRIASPATFNNRLGKHNKPKTMNITI